MDGNSSVEEDGGSDLEEDPAEVKSAWDELQIIQREQQRYSDIKLDLAQDLEELKGRSKHLEDVSYCTDAIISFYISDRGIWLAFLDPCISSGGKEQILFPFFSDISYSHNTFRKHLNLVSKLTVGVGIKQHISICLQQMYSLRTFYWKKGAT